MPDSPLKILIVDDSIVFRKAIEAALSELDGVLITGSVRNGEKAMASIVANPPDLVTLDLEMPDMDGLACLKAIQEFNAGRPELPPVRCLMISGYTKAGADVTIEALANGAFDFIEKPESRTPAESVAKLKESLFAKLKALHASCEKRAGQPAETPEVETPAPEAPRKPEPPPSRHHHAPKAPLKTTPHGTDRTEIIAIGVSTGGPKALIDMLPKLSRMTDLPILIVQHMPPGFTKSLAAQLDSKCQAKVIEASDSIDVEPGHVYIAPGGRHMIVRRLGSKMRIALHDEPPENGCRPAVDVLFRSVAAIYGQSAIGVILTGMGSDGTRGAKPLKASGAKIIVQDEASSVVWGMPGSAVAAGLPDRVESLMDIPDAITAMLRT